MAQAVLIPDDTFDQQMAALEMRYRYAQDSLNKARALYADVGTADEDDPDTRHAKARVQHLQNHVTDLQRAIQRLEERIRS